jgi:hypothetical protein
MSMKSELIEADIQKAYGIARDSPYARENLMVYISSLVDWSHAMIAI